MQFFYAVAVVCLVANANAYSTGAPESSCIDMIPRHHVAPRDTPAPYAIATSTEGVEAGTSMEVTISGDGPEDLIRGVLLEARTEDGDIVGTFTLDSDDPFLKTINCGQPDDAVTHKTKIDKQTLTFTWTPPADFNGDIKFRATIVKTGPVFWVGVESAPVKVIC